MKLLERDSKTKLFVPVAKICTSHFEEEYIYRCGKYINLRDGVIQTIFIKSLVNLKAYFDISLLFFVS